MDQVRSVRNVIVKREYGPSEECWKCSSEERTGERMDQMRSVRNVLVKRETERMDQVRSVRNVLVKREEERDGPSEEC